MGYTVYPEILAEFKCGGGPSQGRDVNYARVRTAGHIRMYVLTSSGRGLFKLGSRSEQLLTLNGDH